MSHRRNNLQLRAALIQSIRAFFVAQGFLEVDTPLRIPANAVEEHIDPQPSGSWFLQTSPEMCMKRLLCRGYERIFQISRCWRHGERGNRHCPEFTMLEWYRNNADYENLMQDCEDLLKWLAVSFCDRGVLSYNGRDIDLHSAVRITVREAFEQFTDTTMEASVAEGTFDEVVVTRIESALPDHSPVFLIDYPAEMAALARLKSADPSVAERFEMYMGGMEIANGFSELNDQREQRERFHQANQKRVAAGHSPLPFPEPFLSELAAMPPSAGIALGIDRLVMLFTNTDRIDDVLTFTPEEL